MGEHGRNGDVYHLPQPAGNLMSAPAILDHKDPDAPSVSRLSARAASFEGRACTSTNSLRAVGRAATSG